MIRLSIVVPCHNEEQTVELFYTATQAIATDELAKRGVELRYVFIDDGSRDRTLAKLRALAAAHTEVSYLSFSRNFGKEAALLAGLQAAVQSGDLIAVMDVDLQDPPNLLPHMCDLALTGEYDRIAVRRTSRKGEPPIRSWFARRFYGLMSRLTDLDLRDGARDFSIMTKRFVEAVLSCGEYNRFTKGLFGWVGYPTTWVEYTNVGRAAGETNWSFWSLVHYAFDGIVAYTVKPLEMLMGIGAMASSFALLALLFVVIRAGLYGDPVSGWPSLMAIILLATGVITFGLGIIGFYLSKIYLEVKGRPVYLIKETSKQDWQKNNKH
ncbi:glycosyltransferase family 2 protein [Atopobium fossor]|uniref:glycosyltransferase family 2 protein n=1 Tax=Atopobium fossor TaxID=39487 RepID=UPI000411EB6C|nr:glycosyltransferase family 2 protein [Atopobium fossor]